jgi:hypothetical protein
MTLDRAILRRGDAYLVNLETLEMATGEDARMRAVVMTVAQMHDAFTRLVETSLTTDEYCAEDPPDRDHVRGIVRSGDGYVADPDTLKLVSGPWAREQAAVVTVVKMRSITHRLHAQGLEWEFIEIESPPDAPSLPDPTHQAFSPADIHAAAKMCECWRQAIEIEVSTHPEWRAPLNGAFVDLCVARDVLADCAMEIERFFAHPPTQQPRTLEEHS